MKFSLEGIKNIMFDLGGVLLNIDGQRSVKAFEDLGLHKISEAHGSFNNELFIRMEKGQVSEAEFHQEVKKWLPEEVTDEQIDQAWCAMLIDFPAKRMQIVQNLKKHYVTYLFSNTNIIHRRHYQFKFQKEYGIDMSSLFVKAFYSDELGLRKPTREAFEKVIALADIEPKNTLFIDDSEENIKAAGLCGLKTFWLQAPLTIEDLFTDFS